MIVFCCPWYHGNFALYSDCCCCHSYHCNPTGKFTVHRWELGVSLQKTFSQKVNRISPRTSDTSLMKLLIQKNVWLFVVMGGAFHLNSSTLWLFFFLPCLVACEISAPDQGSNSVSSESARALTTGLPGNCQMILADKLISPRCLFSCKNCVQNKVYLPPRSQSFRQEKLCPDFWSHFSWILLPWSNVFNSSIWLWRWVYRLTGLAVSKQRFYLSFQSSLAYKPLAVRSFLCHRSSTCSVTPFFVTAPDIVAMCLSRLFQSWVPNHLGLPRLGGFPGGSMIKNPPAM